MTVYDSIGNPIIPFGTEGFLYGNPGTYINRYLRTQYGPIVRGDGTGAIADDPSDVIVYINGTPVTVVAVFGLLGIIVLESSPLTGDDIRVNYTHLSRPTVEIRRLNSKEFVLNADGKSSYQYQKYQCTNVLIDPSYSDKNGFNGGVQPTNPTSYGYFYRAYERAYSIALNDPNLLLLNSPHHRVSYPAFNRILSEILVSYDCNILPEDHTLYPWVQEGDGTASILNGILTLVDSSSGIFPDAKGFYYYRPENLSYLYNASLSFRNRIISYTLNGCFTGVAAGILDGNHTSILSFIEYNGIKYIGILKDNGDETIFDSYESYPLNWSDYNIYRITKTVDSLKVFVNSDSVEVISVLTNELAKQNELEIALNFQSGVFIGSMNRECVNVSEWDYIRYLITPTSISESSHVTNILYECNQLPEVSSQPWFTLGRFGREKIIGDDYLHITKYSASMHAGIDENGLISGEVFGYNRDEPFLSSDAKIVIDWNVRSPIWTHSINSKALGIFSHNNEKNISICFLSDSSIPSLSYNGQTLPDSDPDNPWIVTGEGIVSIVDNVLNIKDYSSSLNMKYTWVDIYEQILSSSFIIEYSNKINDFTPDFVGSSVIVQGDNFEIYIEHTNDDGDKKIVFLDDGNVLASINFDWSDNIFHSYKVIFNITSNLVLFFIDDILSTTFPFTDISVRAQPEYSLSFGSFQFERNGTNSDVDWDYIYAIPLRDDTSGYVGIYLGGDESLISSYNVSPISDLTSYHDYRIICDPIGDVTLFVDNIPKIIIDYKDLPTFENSFFNIPGSGPGVYFGSFDSRSIVKSEWGHIRYTISGAYGNTLIAPHHQILNHQNVMASPDHLFTNGHTHTNFETSSTGIPISQYYDGKLANDAYTILNNTTPIVPITEEAILTKVETPISTFNDPSLILNDSHFLVGDGINVVNIEVSERGLYNTVDIVCKKNGNDTDLIYPAEDVFSGLEFSEQHDEVINSQLNTVGTCFFLNAVSDYEYTSQTVPAKSLLNSSNLIYAGSKFNENHPELLIDISNEEVYSTQEDEALEAYLTYTWGGNILNDPNSIMENNVITGFILNDFTLGSIVDVLP
jgi:hypothetical protein